MDLTIQSGVSSGPTEQDSLASDSATAVGLVERAFGREILAYLVNTVCMHARMMSDEQDPSAHHPEFAWRSRCWDYILQACEMHICLPVDKDLTDQPKIAEMTSMTHGDIDSLRWMLM